MVRIHLGTGAVTWDRAERITDRYGFIYFTSSNSHGKFIGDFDLNAEDVKRLAAKEVYGRLLAVVRETRKSTHLGDWFRGLYPETPNVGEEIYLSDKGLFVLDKNYNGEIAIGIAPLDGRTSDWLYPNMLYRVHEQTVDLYLVTENEAQAES